jgi:hypothetical protein
MKEVKDLNNRKRTAVAVGARGDNKSGQGKQTGSGSRDASMNARFGYVSVLWCWTEADERY